MMTRCPIYVVQPAGLLKSGLWCGFLNPFLTCADLKAGHADGRTFMRAVEEAASGDEDALAKYELTRTSAPVLPAVAPRYTERWVPWVNRKWNGQQPGWRERRYPTAGTVRSGRGRRDWR